MKVLVGQIYIKPGVGFPFSHLFQRWASEQLTSMIQPSDEFVRSYGEDFNLVLNLSAKPGIEELQIKGPTVFRKTKDVEYTVFLPFDVINVSGDTIAAAARHFFNGAITVFESLRIKSNEVSDQMDLMIRHVCSDALMIKK